MLHAAVAPVGRWPTFVILTLLAAIVGAGALAFVRVSRAVRSLEDAEAERRALADLRTTLDEAESAERSFLLTGDDEFRRAYVVARGSWAKRLAKVRALDAAPDVATRLDAIDRLAAPAFQAMASTMTSSDASKLAPRLLREDGRLAGARRAIAALQLDEKQAAGDRATSESSRVSSMLGLFCLGSLAFASVAVFSSAGRRAERKRREQAEQRAALLDLADQFIGVLGHDLRNPLGATTMAGKLIVARAPDETTRSLGGRVVRSGERALRMIDDMLDLARTRLGTGIPVMRTPGDLRDIVLNVVDELRTSHGATRIAWDWRGDGAGRWDPDRISQAVSNLVANALQHGSADLPVRVRLDGTGRELVLEVHNFGEPIPPERFATLFDSYRRRDELRPSKGLGLGLFIAAQIVRAHDGTLDVRSSPDDGTTFTAVFSRPSDEKK